MGVLGRLGINPRRTAAEVSQYLPRGLHIELWGGKALLVVGEGLPSRTRLPKRNLNILKRKLKVRQGSLFSLTLVSKVLVPVGLTLELVLCKVPEVLGDQPT